MTAGVVETLPPTPAIEPGTANDLDVHGFENTGTAVDPQYAFTNPYVPPASNSLDLRIGLQRKQADVDPHPSFSTLRARFFLYSPESLLDSNDKPISLMQSGDGANIIGDVNEQHDPSTFHSNPAGGTISHLALCDPSTSQNPTVCGNDDCYDLEIVTGLLLDSTVPDGNGGNIPKRDVQLWSVPVEVRVTNPKTKDAAIHTVTLTGPPVMGATIEGAPDPNFGANGTTGIETFHTPMIVGDNRLMVVRIGPVSRFTWDQAGTPTTSVRDSVYSHYSGGNECDVTKWDEFKPLTYAHIDPNLLVNGEPKYGFAKYPMRSPSGQAIAPVKALRGTYLWVDQAANNVFFTTLSRQLLGASGGPDLYDTACLPGITCGSVAASESKARHQGWTMMGLWTHGKMVLLDSMVNHADFGLRAEEEFHREVELFCADGGNYDDCNNTNDARTEVRVGAGRDASQFFDSDTTNITDANPLGWINTTVQFGSTEHFFNALPHMTPGTPRDVVWQITAGTRTDEIAFDDYISHRTLIFSPMNGLKEAVGNTAADLVYYDGNDPLAPGDMRLQNAATTLKWDPPSYGDVVASNSKTGRIENVALGGIKGRGFFLFEDSGIRYDIPDSTINASLDAQEWMVSLFYDRRKDPDGKMKRLVTFPSGAYIATHGTRFVKLCPSAGPCQRPELPKPLVERDWTHLAFVLTDANMLEVYQDGFLFATVDRPADMVIEDGALWLGSPDGGTTPGAEGWIDELKVVEGPFSPEEVCNHARGTLVAVPFTYGSGSGVLQDLWQPFDIPNDTNDLSTYREPGRVAVHEALHGLGAVVSPESDLYICSIDYTSPQGVSLHSPGQSEVDDEHARPLRRRLLFPEGPVVWNQPRPGSIKNQFCLSCHREEEKGDLNLAPLNHLPGVLAHADSRRQPLQAPKTILGMIPAHYVAQEKPPVDLFDQSLDSWIDDGPLYQWTMDGAGPSIPNWVIGDPDVGTIGATRFGGASHQPGETRGHALTLDGIDDYAKIDHPIDITGPGMTLATWFQLGAPASASCVDGIVSSRCTLLAKAGANEHWLLEIYRASVQSDWSVRFKVSTVDQVPRQIIVNLPPTFDASAWHHLAATYDNGDLELYLDGNSIYQQSQSASDLVADPNLSVTIGARLNGLGVAKHHLEGKIDDPRIWNRPLLAWEVQDLFDHTP